MQPKLESSRRIHENNSPIITMSDFQQLSPNLCIMNYISKRYTPMKMFDIVDKLKPGKDYQQFFMAFIELDYEQIINKTDSLRTIYE